MADAYQLEGSTDRYLLEDGSGVYLLEGGASDPFFESVYGIERGMKPITAAGMGGVLIE